MNIGPIGSNVMPTNTSNTQNIAAAQPNHDANGGNTGFESDEVNVKKDDDKIPGGAPKPLQQMSTGDFLSLRDTFQEESVMDKLAKIFETILALRLLENTVENVNKSIEESVTKGEQ